MNVTEQTAPAAKPAETSAAAGTASSAHGDSSRPNASITVTKPVEYTVPRIKV